MIKDNIKIKNKLLVSLTSALLVLIVSFLILLFLNSHGVLGFLNQKWDGTTIASSFASGTGAENDPYLIANSYELAYLSKLINDGTKDNKNGGYFYEKSYKLIRNIDLGGYTWTPIGRDKNNSTFNGTFDGNGYTIYDLSLNANSVNKNDSSITLGLFGSVNSGLIKNINLDTININVDEIITDKKIYIGSLVGKLIGTSISSYQNITAKNVNLSGDSSNIDTYSSLLIGTSSNYLFDNIIVSGTNNLAGDTKYGSLIGNNINTSFTNTLVYSSDKEIYGVLDENNSNISSRIYSINNNEISKWQFSDLKYSKYIVTTSLEQVLFEFNENDNITSYLWMIDADNNVILSSGASISPYAMAPADNPVTGLYGSGTEKSPYLIATEYDIDYLRTQVNNGNTYDGYYFQLASDITLNNPYTPIGTFDNSFRGNFDGAGHSIINMNIDITGTTTDLYSYGFFGSIGGGSSQTIKNIEFTNPTITLNVSYSNTNNSGYNIGTVTGTMFNNSHIKSIVVNDLTVTNENSFSVSSSSFHLQIGGIAGTATNTQTSYSNPGSSKQYSIDNCYVSSNISITNLSYSNTRTRSLYSTAGGIIGGIDYQPVWPTNCLYEGSIDVNYSFIGPIFAYVRNSTSTSSTNMRNYFDGNTMGNLTTTSYFYNYRARGRAFTSSVISGSTGTNSNYRYGTSTSNITYNQGVNKGMYLTSYSSYNGFLNVLNNNSDGVTFNYTNGTYHLNKRVTSNISEPNDFYYNISLDDYYNVGNYTYTWYKNGVVDSNFTKTTYTVDRSDINSLFTDTTIDCIVYDGTYYAISRFIIPKLEVNIKFDVDKTNKSISATLTGSAFQYVNYDQYSFQWYRQDITGLENEIIPGANTLSINNLDESYDYTLVATNNVYPGASAEATTSIVDRIVIFVDEYNGNNNNDGYTEETAVKTMQNAYTKLSSSGNINTNIIVIMGSYTTNDFLYGDTSTTRANYKKAATITGLYRRTDYNTVLKFYGASPSSATNGTGRYLYADTKFMYLDFNGSNTNNPSSTTANGLTYLYCQGHSLIMGEGITMRYYSRVANNGLIDNHYDPDFHIFGGFNNYNVTSLSSSSNYSNNGTITIKSGSYARILAGGRNSTLNSVSHNIIGDINNHFKMKIIIDITNSTTATTYTHDVGLITGGQTDGSIYADSIIEIRNGNIGRVLGGSIGYSISSRTSSTYALNTYYGTSTINIYNGTINELYGTALGRVNDNTLSNTYYYGTSVINMYGGTISNNVYCAGAGAVTGYNEVTSDPLPPPVGSFDTSVTLNMTGGTINGNVYGAGYGYSNYIEQYSRATVDAGALYGDSTMNLSGGTINGDVFGAGRGYSYGNLSRNALAQMIGNSTINVSGNVNIAGTIYGGGAGITTSGYANSAKLTGTSEVNLSTNLTKSIYGAGNIAIVEGTSNVNIKSGSYTDVYGGGKVGNVIGTSQVIMTSGNANNIYGSGEQGDSTNTSVQLNGGTVTAAYGGGYNSNVTGTTDVLLNGATLSNLYGGSNYTGDIEKSNVLTKSGSVTNVYGGNNQGGITKNSNIILDGGSITTAYGGGDRATTTTSNVTMNSGTIPTVYGGGNFATTTTSNVDINNGTIQDLFGGGNEGAITTSNVNINKGTITNVYGGGNQAGANETFVSMYGGNITESYGGSKTLGNVTTSNISTLSEIGISAEINVTTRDVTWESTTAKTLATINVILKNNTDVDISDWNIVLNLFDSTLYSNYSQSNILISNNTYTITSDNRYYGKNIISSGGTYSIEFTVLSNTNKNDYITPTYTITRDSYASNLNVGTIYGGNNLGGTTSTSNVTISDGNITTIYGGGNQAVTNDTNVKISNGTINDVYGGGNKASVYNNSSVILTGGTIVNSIFGGGNEGNILSNTYLDATNVIVGNNIYGGGNQAEVYGTTEVNINETTALNIFGGGNAGDVLTNTIVNINNSKINASIYGGGNSATVNGNATTTVAGITEIKESVFGGGNSGAIGNNTSNSSNAKVNILGANVTKNVYGGCNTSVVYGTTTVNIGSSAQETSLLKRADITIYGTVFGGGEANASGSENYDFTFISVTKGIDINIDGTDYTSNQLVLNGSVFGSGNASSSSGNSNIYIKNLGTRLKPNKAISIQRANLVDIDNSTIELVGTTDRTNEYSSIKYSFNRIDDLKIRNNTVLLLQRNANLLRKFESLTSDGSIATATIADDGTTTRNVDNRLYVIANRSLNVTTNEMGTAYGDVIGMTFFGMYNAYDNGSYSYGIYNKNNNESATGGDVIMGGSYVLGLHAINMDYTKDGFYTNYINDEYTKVNTGYIIPTPESSNYYIWTIGIDAINYSFSLTASKYSSLGTYELSLIDFAKGNTTFNVLGFNSEGLTSGVSLVDSNDVPKIGSTEEESNSVLGLSLKSETQEWTSHNTTKFISTGNGSFTGDDSYTTDNQPKAPSMTFYLYHAKNISLNKDLGTIVITLQALTPKNEIEFDVKLITITISLDARTYTDTASYDASITYGKKYEMPSITDVNITNRSQFTAYYSLFYEANNQTDIYGLNNDNYRTLTSNFALPTGTKITMIDLASDEHNPNYYYYQISNSDYTNSVNQLATDNEVTYDLSKFISMNSTSSNNLYNDAKENNKYYHDDIKYVMEEFIFIFDFENTTIIGENSNNSIILELRTNEDRTSISVLGIRQDAMRYNLYDSSNAVLNAETIVNDNYLYYDTEKPINYNVTVDYNKTTNLQSIIDTNYESNSMGINISLYDNSGNAISSSMLVGTNFRIGSSYYYPSSDGIFRIKLSNKVSNLSRLLYMTTGNNLPPGIYNMHIDLFSSNDGLHMINGSDNRTTLSFTVVGSNNAISTNMTDESKVIDGVTGLNNNEENVITTGITYQSVLSNPNIRLVVYKRNTSSSTDVTYREIDATTIISSELIDAKSRGFTSSHTFEYLIVNNPSSSFNDILTIKDNIPSGTYKFVYNLYDRNQLIDSDTEFVIVKKN